MHLSIFRHKTKSIMKKGHEKTSQVFLIDFGNLKLYSLWTWAINLKAIIFPQALTKSPHKLSPRLLWDFLTLPKKQTLQFNAGLQARATYGGCNLLRKRNSSVLSPNHVLSDQNFIMNYWLSEKGWNFMGLCQIRVKIIQRFLLKNWVEADL